MSEQLLTPLVLLLDGFCNAGLILHLRKAHESLDGQHPLDVVKIRANLFEYLLGLLSLGELPLDLWVNVLSGSLQEGLDLAYESNSLHHVGSECRFLLVGKTFNRRSRALGAEAVRQGQGPLLGEAS